MLSRSKEKTEERTKAITGNLHSRHHHGWRGEGRTIQVEYGEKRLGKSVKSTNFDASWSGWHKRKSAKESSLPMRQPILTIVGNKPPPTHPPVSADASDRSILLSILASHHCKRCFDLVFAASLLIMLLPGFLLIALLIKTSSHGPIFFRQRRYGLNNELFEIFKFRTMFVEAADYSGIRQTYTDDPRITAVGRFLRRASLDELPQLLNVIKGDMSLVGPRPHVPGMLAGGMLYEELVPYYFERHAVRPGITGLAQVKGLRGSTELATVAVARVDHDIQYINIRSVTLDFRILVETGLREFIWGRGS